METPSISKLSYSNTAYNSVGEFGMPVASASTASHVWKPDVWFDTERADNTLRRKEIKLEAVRIRDLQMVVVNIAEF